MIKSIAISLAMLWLAPAASQASPAAEPSIRFLSQAEGRTVLTVGEERGYYERMQLADMRAKTGLPLQSVSVDAAREQVSDAYGAAVDEFTVEEATALREAVTGLQAAIRTKAPLYARAPWSFIKVSTQIEGGLPHTRGDYIILSDALLTNIVRRHAANPRAAPVSLWNLLIHEQTHVLQRRHAELFAGLYTQIFGFRHVVLEPAPGWLRERNIVNPDAPDSDWVFPVGEGAARHWILPLLVLKNLDHPRMPDDFDVVSLDVEEHPGSWTFGDRSLPPAFRELADRPDYVRAFPDQNEDFHPNEISAGLLAAIFSGSPLKNPEHPLWGRTRTWADKALR
jgi:hypothetical protein